MKNTIEKTTFLAALDCLTKGWFAHHQVEEAPSRDLQWKYFFGNEVAKHAREWLGPGRMLRRTPYPDALVSTAQFIANPDSALLFEASFQWEGCAARADAIRRNGAGWDLIEIKAGTGPKEGEAVKDEYILDIAYTLFVARLAGLRVAAGKLVLVNREYRLGGPAPRFVEVDVTEQAEERIAEYKDRVSVIVAAATQEDKPTPCLKLVCKDCDFFETDCLGLEMEDPLFILPRLSKKKFAELRSFERISRLPLGVDLTDIQLRVMKVIQSGRAYIDREALASIGQIEYPAYYLDFETVMPHFPWFADRPPFDTTPFQYSLHVRECAGGALAHRSYLAPTEGDWRRDLTIRLLDDLGETGSIVHYSPFEKTQLNALKLVFPDLASRIAVVVARLFDLRKVIENGYVHPGFGGSTSIKKVLPVIAPDLTYDGLHVGNGQDASACFALMRVGEISKEEHERERKALEKYCQLDTEAMVRLHEFLEALSGTASEEVNVNEVPVEFTQLLTKLNGALGAQLQGSEVPNLPASPGWKASRKVLEAWAAKSRTTLEQWSADARQILERWWAEKKRCMN